MTATLTLDFGNRLKPDESREVIGESIRRNVPIEDILTEAIRLWRAHRNRETPGDNGELRTANREPRT